MKQQTFAEMRTAEFDALIDGYITREATAYGEMPAEVFLDLLLERAEAQVAETLNLAVALKGNRLVITPDREVGDVMISGNEILVGGHRLVLEMATPG
jgi:uncharacterized protein YheU (UPF0270 family)